MDKNERTDRGRGTLRDTPRDVTLATKRNERRQRRDHDDDDDDVVANGME